MLLCQEKEMSNVEVVALLKKYKLGEITKQQLVEKLSQIAKTRSEIIHKSDENVITGDEENFSGSAGRARFQLNLLNLK
jgi:hypothetical protein